MNKLFKVLALTAMLVIGGQAMAQSHGAMFVSAAFPMKDYADFDNLNDFALVSSSFNDAGAGIGVNAGLKGYFNVGVKGLNVLLSVDGFYNGPCSALKTAYHDAEASYEGQFIGGSFKYNATPRYINAPGMLGINYIYHFNPSFGLYVEAGAGANLRFITNMESVSKTTILGVETQTTTLQEYDLAVSFAYQAGIGIEVAENLIIGCSFYDLGGAVACGEQTIKTKTFNDNVTNTTNNYRELGTVHPIMVLGRIGFCF